ncbi:VOC family protein [Bradyrhizobium sp. USDA 4508]
MSLPITNHDPGFRITRASHVVLTVRDLAASRQFYEKVIGLILTAEEGGALYFRGVEEACHHSLVLRKGEGAACARLGLRVFQDDDLDRSRPSSKRRDAGPPGRKCRIRAAPCMRPIRPARRWSSARPCRSSRA